MKVFIFLSLFVLRLPEINGQNLETALGQMSASHPVEKIYIHYDKDYYVAGETIWFKAYLYNNNRPSPLSNNFYLRVSDERGKIICTKKYPISGATVRGDIQLPDSLNEGYYHIQALTPVMVNNYPEFLYSKDLFVFNPSAKKDSSGLIPGSISTGTQFFPESGTLVAELLSVVAFRVFDSIGQPLTINGVLRTDEGTKIMEFKTNHEGIGKFQFKPMAGKKYIAAVEINGQSTLYDLPEVKIAGINLRIEKEKGGYVFLLQRSKNEKEKYDKLRLIAEMNNFIFFDKEIYFDNYYSVKGHIIADSLPSGILHFTVFDKDGSALAERLSFLDNKEYNTRVKIEVNKKGLAPREENIVNISFPEAAQRSLSVSVTDINGTANEESNLFTDLFLTSDLKSSINNPKWYFEDGNSIRETALDDLLLTQSWTRFNWKKVLSGEFPKRVYEDRYLLSVSGSIKETKTNERVNGGRLVIYLDAEDSINQNFEIPVNENGSFLIDSLLFSGEGKFYYAYTSAQGKEKTVSLTFDSVPDDLVFENLPVNQQSTYFETKIPSANQVDIEKRRNSFSMLSKLKVLDPVVVQSSAGKRPIDLVNERYTKGMFTTMGKMNIDLINSPAPNRSASVYDYIKSNVRYVREQNGNFASTKNFSLNGETSFARNAKLVKSLDSIAELSGQFTPGSNTHVDDLRIGGDQFIVAVFLNENLVDMSFLKTIRMDNIALIKFYEPGFAGAGMNGPGGTLAIYTKNEVEMPVEQIDKLEHFNYIGYSLRKNFYSPDYSLTVNANTEDNRFTLYWNPEVYTDSETKSLKIRFFNNGFTRSYKITIRGFDANGKLIYAEKIID